MAPEVVVPANFGKHHLKSRSHSNLELLCNEGEIKRANSMILSLNSSVIDDLISRLDITSLDVQDFGAGAVGCFVESMYSGELEKCDKSNFRDLNKMGHVFNVSWFTERCLEYFTEHVDMLTGRCYEDVLFVVEEARFVEESQKKNNFTSLVEDKLNTMRNRKSMFLKQYSNDLSNISISQLKMVVKLAGSDVGILVHILVRHLKITGSTSFVETSRFLFENIDFECCFAKRRFHGITIELCDILMEKFNEDFKSAITLFISKPLAEVNSNDDKIHYPVLDDVPVKEFLCYDIDTCLEFLSSSDKVTNTHHLFDALYTWMHLWKDNDPKTAVKFEPEEVLEEIINIKEDRCWNKASVQYLKALTADNSVSTSKLRQVFLDCQELSGNDNHWYLSSNEQFPFENVLTENLKITLVSEEKISSCKKETKCAIMMQTTPINSQDDVTSFSLKVLQEREVKDNDEVHYHDVIEAHQSVSFIIRLSSENKKTHVLPIPFNINPSWSGFWHWGFFSFNKYGICGLGPICHYVYCQDKNAKIVFNAVVSDK
ncbi:uncharacterized protein LOC134813606 [Bolinopsis microptera]|uniref:uncharacterized protein LOC134813606 n=1 Tax=Bolinopsis microptera TaxID=2820187 RepID=UPI003079938B